MMPRYALGIGDRPCLLAVLFLLQDTRHKPGQTYLLMSGGILESTRQLRSYTYHLLFYSEGFVPVPLTYLIVI